MVTGMSVSAGVWLSRSSVQEQGDRLEGKTMSPVIPFGPNQEEFGRWLTHLPQDMIMEYAKFFAGTLARSTASVVVDQQVYLATRDMTYGDVARALGVSAKSVQKRVIRYRERHG